MGSAAGSPMTRSISWASSTVETFRLPSRLRESQETRLPGPPLTIDDFGAVANAGSTASAMCSARWSARRIMSYPLRQRARGQSDDGFGVIGRRYRGSSMGAGPAAIVHP